MQLKYIFNKYNMQFNHENIVLAAFVRFLITLNQLHCLSSVKLFNNKHTHCE